MKIDWIAKLSSRKFWCCLIGFVTALLVAFNVGDNWVSQVSAIISAFGTLVIYILSESRVDAAAASADQTVTTNNTEKTYNTVMSKDLNAEQEVKKQSVTTITPNVEMKMKQTPVGGG